MATYRTRFEVPGAPEDVFAYLSDFSRTEEWDPGIVEASRLDAGPLGIGSRFRVVAGFLGRRVELEYELAEHKPSHGLLFRGGGAGLDSEDEIHLEPVGTDRTRVSWEARLRVRGALGGIVDPLLSVAFRWIGNDAARGLERRLRERAEGR